MARSFGFVFAAAAAFAFWSLRTDAPDHGGAPADAPSVASLREQVALAREARLYFLLDPSARTLTLFSGGSPLRVWAVERVHVGARRLRYPDSALDVSWSGRGFEHPRIDPPLVRERRVIVSDSVEAPDLSGADEWIPPLPEEAWPAPDRFAAHYDGGLGVQVVASDEDGDAHLFRAAARLLAGWSLGLDRYRVRITMSSQDVGSLYRAYPAEAAFLIRMPLVRQDDTRTVPAPR